jgi:hypothetical protein
MLTKQKVNLFKFDGIGTGWDAYGAEKYQKKKRGQKI